MIRRATPLDLTWLVDLGARAFAQLGDYRDILPAWLAQDNVSAWVAEHDGERRGFTVVGFFVGDSVAGEASDASSADENIADLLALAVEPAWQSRGLGRSLVDHTVAMASATARAGRLRELRLCVADDNAVGQRLYRTSGFHHVAGEFGAYPGGQRAVRMVYPLVTTR
ncbi:MAG TPA: N-acetyltransferase [Kofleriaceae bacterium]|nr:N-acetyltransferase [Kofleriaceae bacterium]